MKGGRRARFWWLHRGGSATVTVHVRHLGQLFNSLDPSPFWDRDLDGAAAAFIEDEFRDKRSAATWHLHVHTLEGAELAPDLQAAVEHYYERMGASARMKLRENRRIAEMILLAGIGIFLVCMMLRQLLRGMFASLPRMLDEGLIILAWIALWRPAEALVYEWIPLYRTQRLYQRLAGIRVTVRTDAPTAVARPTSQTTGSAATPGHASR
jgi:hypothetical protein